MSTIESIDADLLAEMGSDTEAFRAAFTAADETTRTAVVGYLNTYAGPWGLKASEEDAVLGILAALHPGEWARNAECIAWLRADSRLGEIADFIAEDCGETAIIPLVESVVARLREVLA